MFQTFISRHNSNFFSDKLVLTSVTPASSAPVLQTPKATSSTLYFRSEERFSRNAETDLVCRLLLEKKKKITNIQHKHIIHHHHTRQPIQSGQYSSRRRTLT